LEREIIKKLERDAERGDKILASSSVDNGKVNNFTFSPKRVKPIPNFLKLHH
jgi:hypothetical protein